MRSLFIVAAKLLGIFMLLWVLGAVSALVHILSYLAQGDPAHELRLIMRSQVVALCSQIVLYLAVSALLLFRTEWLSRVLRIESGELPAAPLTTDNLLFSGIALIGLYIALTSLPSLVVAAWRSLQTLDFFARTWIVAPPSTAEFLKAALTLALGAICLLRPRWVMRLISRYSRPPLEGNATP